MGCEKSQGAADLSEVAFCRVDLRGRYNPYLGPSLSHSLSREALSLLLLTRYPYRGLALSLSLSLYREALSLPTPASRSRSRPQSRSPSQSPAVTS